MGSFGKVQLLRIATWQNRSNGCDGFRFASVVSRKAAGLRNHAAGGSGGLGPQ